MNKNNGKYIRMFCLLLTVLCLSGCGIRSSTGTVSEEDSDEAATLVDPDETYEKTTVSGLIVQDKESLYEEYGAEEPAVIYLTVGRGNEGDDTDHSWTEVNQSKENISCEAVFQMGDETAPQEGEFGYGALTANATVRLQGTASLDNQQKSYRVSIRDGKGNLDGMKSLVLSKNFSDPLRFRNKLASDLMVGIPGMFSTRTRLVHLYIKDKSENEDLLYEDYGLYTMTEPVNKSYLSSRGLSKDAPLYKAENFDWSLQEALKNSTDADYDAASFSQILEIKGKEDHSTLMTVLAAVNDESVPIEDTIAAYFDEDNLYNYMAFSVLMGNRDAALTDCYYYNPTGTTTFYLIGWNNSDILSRASDLCMEKTDREPWNYGIFSLTDSRLYARMLQSEVCRTRLEQAVRLLYDTYLTEDRVKTEADRLSSLVKPYLYEMPDMIFAGVLPEEYDTLTEGLYEEIRENYDLFYDSLQTPWPFHILEPEASGGETNLVWEKAYAFDSSVTYEITLDDSWDFSAPIGTWEVTDVTNLNVGTLQKGEYFVKITAVCGNGNTQDAKEYYNTEKKTVVNGTLCFYILDDGTAEACFMQEED